jgi:hypothetical protein
MFGALQRVGEANLWLISGQLRHLAQIVYLTYDHPNLLQRVGEAKLWLMSGPAWTPGPDRVTD